MPAKHSYSLHYHNGHFYDPETRQRTVLRDGVELQLTASPGAFLEFEPAGDYYPSHAVRTEDAMRRELAHDAKVGACFLLLPAGTELRFALHPPKPPVPEAAVAEYTFQVVLDEPLFVYHRAKPGKSDDPGSLVDSRCWVVSAKRTSHGYDNAPDRLLYFEPVYARSLNSLIKNTYVHYFQNAGAPGRSAFEAMYIPELGITLGELREQKVPVLPGAPKSKL
ncbi:hypothetical protein [Hymenobacter defluvii]|uniref:Uncharacterized protein n=1 Tax=Hymenobacter defluvii TaxID=2054411 RepID=A0ABS3TH51_9BACT|nr:hypothetical protein [Hymenobacter defluvii]MBO3272980.1 hypothetical protein [Hymenobacter defluvii]